MLATTLSSHWAKGWPRNSSRIKKLLESRRLSWSISVSPSPMVSNLIVCLIEVEELRQKRTNEDKSTPIWSDFAKQHNQGAIRGFILQHRLIVCDRSLNDFFQQVEVPPSLLIHGCLRQDAVSSPDWKWSYPARRFPSALFPEPVIPNIITSKIHHKTRLLKL